MHRLRREPYQGAIVADADRIAAALRYQQEQQPADPLESFRSLAGLKSAYERRVQPIINNAAQTFSTGGVIGDLLRSYGEAASPANAAVLKGMGMPYQGPMTAPREEGVTSGKSFRPMGDSQQQFSGQLLGDPTNLAQPVGARLANALKFAKPDAMKMVKDLSMGAISPMDTWHGSPHRFLPTAKNPLGEFDPMKIGTGEGAQAYGVGAGYLAEAKGTAKGYAETLANRDIANQGRLNAHANAQRLANLAGDAKYAADDVRYALETNPQGQEQLLRDTLQHLESGSYARPLENKGNLYKVDLPDEQIAKMFDWDKPFDKQHPEVQQALVNIANGEDEGSKMLKLMQSGNPSGKDIFRSLLTEPQLIDSPAGWISVDNKKEISQLLQTEGIPGIRYLDQGSRGAGQGTSNFVVFDPKHMNIIGRE